LIEADRDRIAVSTGLTRTGCGAILQSIPFSVDLADWVSGKIRGMIRHSYWLIAEVDLPIATLPFDPDSLHRMRKAD
jgi:hypothetical protein